MSEGRERNSVVGGLLVLFARGVLLWVVVPIASLVWVLVAIRLRRRGVTFGQYLGWVDVNLVAFLQRTLFRPVVRSRTPFVPPLEIPSVSHRLHPLDPV